MFVITDITLSERNNKSELFYGVTTNEKYEILYSNISGREARAA